MFYTHFYIIYIYEYFVLNSYILYHPSILYIYLFNFYITVTTL